MFKLILATRTPAIDLGSLDHAITLDPGTYLVTEVENPFNKPGCKQGPPWLVLSDNHQVGQCREAWEQNGASIDLIETEEAVPG